MTDILIIEDEELVRSPYAQTLSEDGYHITAVGTGRAAWDAIQDLAFDVIILDLSLPDADGLELLREIRTARHSMKILVTSGFMVGDEMPALALAAGATAVLAKPISPRRFRNSVYQLIDPSLSWRGSKPAVGRRDERQQHRR
jgi:DNA-binding response OmpR family regulator